jgi:hypothetical protein
VAKLAVKDFAVLKAIKLDILDPAIAALYRQMRPLKKAPVASK